MNKVIITLINRQANETNQQLLVDKQTKRINQKKHCGYFIKAEQLSDIVLFNHKPATLKRVFSYEKDGASNAHIYRQYYQVMPINHKRFLSNLTDIDATTPEW